MLLSYFLSCNLFGVSCKYKHINIELVSIRVPQTLHVVPPSCLENRLGITVWSSWEVGEVDIKSNQAIGLPLRSLNKRQSPNSSLLSWEVCISCISCLLVVCSLLRYVG